MSPEQIRGSRRRRRAHRRLRVRRDPVRGADRAACRSTADSYSALMLEIATGTAETAARAASRAARRARARRDEGDGEGSRAARAERGRADRALLAVRQRQERRARVSRRRSSCSAGRCRARHDARVRCRGGAARAGGAFMVAVARAHAGWRRAMQGGVEHHGGACARAAAPPPAAGGCERTSGCARLRSSQRAASEPQVAAPQAARRARRPTPADAVREHARQSPRAARPTTEMQTLAQPAPVAPAAAPAPPHSRSGSIKVDDL